MKQPGLTHSYCKNLNIWQFLLPIGNLNIDIRQHLRYILIVPKEENNSTEPLPDRYALGLHDDWPAVVAMLIDLGNSPSLDETSLRILRLALDGYSFREIGRMLGMSHNTAIKKLRDLVKG